MAVMYLFSIFIISALNTNCTVKLNINTSKFSQINKFFTGNLSHASDISRFGGTMNLNDSFSSSFARACPIVVFVGSDPPLSPIRFGETVNLNESFAFSCLSSSTSPSFSTYSFFLATNASIVFSGVVTLLSPNRVSLENQYFHSEILSFHQTSFNSILISKCFQVSPGLFSSNRWLFLPITGPPFYCRRRSRLNLSISK